MKKSAYTLLSLALLVCMAATAFGQYTILFSPSHDDPTWDGANGLQALGMCAEDEVYSVTPAGAVGLYSAHTYMGRVVQWAYVGDADLDGRFVDSSTAAPGGDIDAVFVRQGDTGPFTPRDIFISKEGTDGMAVGFEDGDVFRYAGPNGALEFFVTEALLLPAVGGTSSWDTNAICQSAAGDLFLSTNTANGVIGDGDIAYIPASAITYDANGNVSAITAGSAVMLATEAELEAVAAASGMLSSVGGTVGTSISELSALEIDPNGGTWTPASSGLTVPNLLFSWGDYSNDGAIISTAGGGQIPLINGVPMADPIATQGIQVGITPGSTGIYGLEGLALIPQQAPELALENYPVDLHTSTGTGASWHQVEVGGALPNNLTMCFVAVGPLGPGGVVQSVFVGGGEFFIGTFFMQFMPISTDPLGYGQINFVIPPTPSLVGANITFQVIENLTFKISLPSAVHFI
jgi:hypothetical protein